MKQIPIFFLITGFLFFWRCVASDIAVYDFQQSPGSDGSQLPNWSAPHAIVSPLRRGPGIVGISTNPSLFSSVKWTTDPLQVSGNDYLEIQVSPEKGFRLTLKEIRFWETVSARGPAAFVIRTSQDHFQGDLTEHFPLDARVSSQERSIPLDERFANLTEPVTFRFYAYGSRSSNGGSWSLGRTGESGPLKIVGEILPAQ